MGKSAMQGFDINLNTTLLCAGVVTAEMFQSQHDTGLKKKMIEEFDEDTGLQYKKFMAFPWILTVTWPLDMDCGVYPLTMPGPYWKKFRCNFCELIVVLIQQGQNSVSYDSYLMDTVISLLTELSDYHARALLEEVQGQNSVSYDSYLMDTVISLLTELSDSRIRAFRHTCTLSALKLLTALVSVAVNLGVNKDNTHRLYEEERNKMTSKRACHRQEQLEKKIKEDRIMSMILDKDHEVAAQSMKLLMLISQNCKDVLSLEDCKTMYQFVYSSHRPLATTAGEFLYKKNCKDVLSLEDCKTMYQFVYSSHRPLATTAGEFLYKKHVSYLVDSLWDCASPLLKDWESVTELLLHDPQLGEGLNDSQESILIEILLASVRQAAEGHPPARRGTGKEHLDVLRKQMKDVIEKHTDPEVLEACSRTYQTLWSEEMAIYNQVNVSRSQLINQWVDKFNQLLKDFLQELHRHVSYLVDSLWDCASPLLKDWESVTELLLHDPQQGEGLNVSQESILIEILLASVRQAAEGHPPAGRGTGKKVFPAKERKVQVDDCVKIIEHFIVVLPELLAKYSTDANKVTSLLQIPQYFSMDVYSTCSRIEGHLDVLLMQMKDVIEKHTDPEVLEAGSRAYQALWSKEMAIHNQVNVSRSQLINQWVDKFNQLLKDFLQELFLRLKQGQGSSSCGSSIQTIRTIKELARRFSLTFSWDQIKSRESVTMMHKDGIEFAFKRFVQNGQKQPPPNIAYLTILSEFSNKLLKPDKKTVYGYLQRYTGNQMLTYKEDGWISLVCYRASLLASGLEDDSYSLTSTDTFKESSHTNHARAMPLKRKLSNGWYPLGSRNGKETEESPDIGHPQDTMLQDQPDAMNEDVDFDTFDMEPA
ncbi:UNVERIFIED_CONTAM: hypothetical protein FKN15_015041 [Acipenser sinensis]